MLHSLLRLRTKRLAVAAAVAAILVGAYALLGFIVAPRWLRATLTDFVASHYHRQLTLGDIRFNPFTLTLDVRDISLPDADAQPLMSLGSLHVTLQTATLWRLAPSFAEIVLERPFARVLVRPDGSMNLADLAKPFATGTAPPRGRPTPSAPLRLHIERLSVVAGRATYEDRTHTNPFQVELRPVSFELSDFSTVGAAPNQYQLDFATPLGERFHLAGSVDVAPLAARGRFTVAGLRARTLWSYLRDSVRPEVASGDIALEGDYAFVSGAASPQLRVSLKQLTVSDLGLRSPGAANDVEVKQLDLRDVQLDLEKRSIAFGAIRLAGGDIRARLEHDGSINLQTWLSAPPSSGTGRSARPTATGSASSGGTPSGAASSGGTSSGSGSSWSLSAPDISISGLRVEAADQRLTPAPTVVVSDIAVHLAGLRVPAAAPVELTARASLERQCRLEVRGTYDPASRTAHAQLALSRFDLIVLQPYFARYSSVSLLSGRFGARITVDRGTDGALIATGGATIEKLRTVDEALRQDLVKWDRLSIEALRYRSQPARLTIGRIVVRQPYARVIIAPDRSLNIAQALKPPPIAATTAPPATGAPSAAAVAPAQRPAARAAVAESSGAAGDGAQTAERLPISIRRIEIENGSARYNDRWIEPHFFLAIESLGGDIDNISSSPDSRARFALDGKVDRYAPIRLSGETNLFAPGRFTELKMSFKGVELTTATPYSAHFAGYKIEKGKISADIDYHIADRQLTANHHIVIDQLQLGERVDSPDAVKLPVKLAVALLKDRHGVIDLGLPVSGSLDDPQFKVGPLIWKAVVNVLEKAAAAPFALLGRAFGGGGEIKEIDFDPGSATLDSEARQRLSVLAKALAAKPALELDVPSTFTPDLDGPALSMELLRRRLIDRKRRELAARKRYNDSVEESVLADPAEHLRLLAAEYRDEFGKSAAFPGPEATIQSLESALSARIKVSDTDLRALGRRRARAVQAAILGPGGVEASRLFILDSGAAPSHGERVQLDLGLK